MKKIILGLFVAGILLTSVTEGQAQIGINLKNQKKYQREHTSGALSHRHLKRKDFRHTSDSKASYETGAAVYQKTLKKEKRQNSKIAARYIKHPKLSVKVKEKNKTGI